MSVESWPSSLLTNAENVYEKFKVQTPCMLTETVEKSYDGHEAGLFWTRPGREWGIDYSLVPDCCRVGNDLLISCPVAS